MPEIPMEQRSTSFFAFFRSGTFWCCFFGMSFFLLSSVLLNKVVFPQFDSVFTYARDISIFAHSVTLIVIAIIATWKPSLLKSAPMTLGMLCSLALGILLSVAGLQLASPLVLVFGSSLNAIGRGWVAVVLGLAFTRLDSRSVGTCLALAFPVSFLLKGVLAYSGLVAGVTLFYLLPFAIVALTWADARGILKKTEMGQAPADIAVTRPSSFLPLASQMFVCLFLFRVAFGYSLRFGEIDGVPLSDFIAILPLLAIAFWVIFSKKPFHADRVTQISVLFIIAGFLLVPSTLFDLSRFAVSMLSAGSSCFDMVAWAVLIALAAKNEVSAVAVLAWGRGISGVGTIVGAGVANYVNSVSVSLPGMAAFISGIIILIFVGYALIGLKDFSFGKTIAGVTSADEIVVKVSSPEEIFQARCKELAELYKLGPRETEVFLLLARGRNNRYIQEKLVLSRNTVKAHIKHIYTKMDIHDHQELIDMVEES